MISAKQIEKENRLYSLGSYFPITLRVECSNVVQFCSRVQFFIISLFMLPY